MKLIFQTHDDGISWALSTLLVPFAEKAKGQAVFHKEGVFMPRIDASPRWKCCHVAEVFGIDSTTSYAVSDYNFVNMTTFCFIAGVLFAM